MFKQLFSALKGRDTLDAAFAEFGEMLEAAQWMFGRATAMLTREADAAEHGDELYQRDQLINDLLKGIRRKIVRHLTINPGVDVPASLALMSVAKDAERIGDYCKNVYEVGRFYSDAFHLPKYHDPLEAVRMDVESLFVAVRKAWSESDHKQAKQVIEQVGGIRSRCDELIQSLLNDRAQLQTHEAVAYSLLARHYKRVAAHLANISTAVTGKIEDLDFRP
jgi:phosphate transport system protein